MRLLHRARGGRRRAPRRRAARARVRALEPLPLLVRPPDAEALGVHTLATESLAALRGTFRPDGFNLGWNLGRVAGAGIVDHVHLHVVPRWSGDTNFMPVLADVKVMPEHLADTRRKLATAWPSPS
jgi:diadenosine tetraphosphate (Ap4A) HIT family hydrolase